jgi:uncharacterized protein YxeA
MKEILKEIIGLTLFIIFMGFCVYEISLVDDNTITSNKLLTPTVELKIKNNKVDTFYIYKLK